MKNSLWWKEDLLCQLLQAPVHIILILSSILRWKRSGTHAHTHMQTHKNKQTKNREWDRVQNALSLQQLSVPGRKITSQKRHVTSVRLPLFAPSFQQHRGRIYSTEDPISHKQHCQNTSTYCYWLIKKEKKSAIFHQPTFSGIQEGIHYFFFRWLGRWLIYPLTGFLDSLSKTLRGNVRDWLWNTKNDQPECNLHCLHESTDPMLKFPFPANTVNKQSSKGVAEHRSGRLIN